MNITITEKEKGQRVDKFLIKQLSAYSRAFLQKLIKKGHITVNSKSPKQSYVLKEGDVVGVDIPEEESSSWQFLEPDESIEFAVLYEDKNVIVIDKPAGLTVHPSDNEKEGTLVNGLMAKYPDIRDVGEDQLRPGIVHRLDKETSGVMIIARDNRTFQLLKSKFKNRDTVKTYIALVAGDVAKDKGMINFPIARQRKLPTKQVAIKDDRQARGVIRDAVTEYEVLRSVKIGDKNFTLVKVTPKTGRLHQIRVHFQAIGHPVAGDTKYGAKEKVAIKGLDRHFLHAESLEISIPKYEADGTVNEERKIFVAPLPKELKNIIGK